MTELVSTVPAIEISTDTIVEVETTLPNLQVNTSESITVEIQPDTYVLSSSGMYTGNMTGKIPTWILDAIQEQLTTGDGNIASVLDDIQLLLNGLQLGVNQAISQIENTNTSMSALETSLSSRIQGNEAAILDVYATKVTPTEAQAIAVQAIGSTFGGNVDAYIGNLASTYTNADSATATNIRTLQASYNEQTTRLDTVEYVKTGLSPEWDGISTPTIGEYKEANGVFYTYVGGTLGEFGDGWMLSKSSPYTYADTAVSVLEESTGISIEELRNQIDGVIDSWYYNYVPDQTKEPWSTWIAIDTANGNTNEQIAHSGDLFYDLTTGTAYRFSLSGSVYGWAVITDTSITLALQNSSIAQYTADGKSSVYYSESVPVPKIVNGTSIPIKQGDLWIKISTGVAKVASIDSAAIITDWIDTSNKAAIDAQTAANTANSLLADIASDSKLVATEKQQVKKEWDIIVSEKSTYVTQAGTFGVSTTSYVAAYDALNAYLNVTIITPNITPLLASLTATSDIDSATFRSTFGTYYTARTALLNSIATATKTIADNARNGVLHNAALATPPMATGKNDIWVVTDRWYDAAGTVVTVSGPVGQLGKYKNLVKVWDGTAWIQKTLAETQSLGVSWVGGASKLLYGPDGGITGWEFANGSGLQSEFKINAQKFSISDGITGYTPFSIVGSNIVFNGRVSFNSITDSPKTYTGKLYETSTETTVGLLLGTYVMKYDYSVLRIWTQISQYATALITVTPVAGSTFIANTSIDDTGTNAVLSPNQLFTYNGTTWVKGAMSTAEIISNINGNSNNTTIDGNKITTGSILTGVGVKSTNYQWGTVPTGFGVFSSGDPDSGNLYNIVGGSLYGGTVYAAALDGAYFTHIPVIVSNPKVGSIIGQLAESYVKMFSYSKGLTAIYASAASGSIMLVDNSDTCLFVNYFSNTVSDYNVLYNTDITITVSVQYIGTGHMYLDAWFFQNRTQQFTKTVQFGQQFGCNTNGSLVTASYSVTFRVSDLLTANEYASFYSYTTLPKLFIRLQTNSNSIYSVSTNFTLSTFDNNVPNVQ